MNSRIASRLNLHKVSICYGGRKSRLSGIHLLSLRKRFGKEYHKDNRRGESTHKFAEGGKHMDDLVDLRS